VPPGLSNVVQVGKRPVSRILPDSQAGVKLA
jgi:hypothetical protein